ncbi:MAG TPA: YceI family protein [Streptosporangiaceae bacterium]|jgi:polyisoprenoid-binding protein YceI
MTQAEHGPGEAQARTLAMARAGELAGQWRLDAGASRVEFGVPHFWHAITVRGWFEQLEGEATVGPDGTVSGQLVIGAASLTTKNKQRDKHLRSADFFDADNHAQVVVTVQQAALADDGHLTAEGTLEAAGTTEPVTFTAEIVEASADAVTLRASVTIDRSRFGMTWSPMKIAAMEATGTVTARFTREPAAG